MASEVLVGLLMNLITVAIGAVAGVFFVVFRYKSLLKFYGIRRPQDAIRIVVPRLDVKAGERCRDTGVQRIYGTGRDADRLRGRRASPEQDTTNIFSWLSRKCVTGYPGNSSWPRRSIR